jgi:hypothetical protein
MTADQTAQAYSTMPWGAIAAPFLVGMVADRFFAADHGGGEQQGGEPQGEREDAEAPV